MRLPSSAFVVPALLCTGLALVASGGAGCRGETTPGQAPAAPKAAPGACAPLADRYVTLTRALIAANPALDEAVMYPQGIEQAARVLVEGCEATAWEPPVIQCYLAAAELVDTGRCLSMLGRERRSWYERFVMERMRPSGGAPAAP